jgi:hypothetical protein
MASVTGAVADSQTQVTVTFSSEVDSTTVDAPSDWTVEPVTDGVPVSVRSVAVAVDLLSVVLTVYPRMSAGVDYVVDGINAYLLDVLLVNESAVVLTNESLELLTTG